MDVRLVAGPRYLVHRVRQRGSGRPITSDNLSTVSDLARLIDATDSADDRIDYPEIVEEFLDMGFTQLGRVLLEPTQGTHEDTAAEYEPELRAKYLAHCDVPTPILRAPDGSAFVDVSWFWDAPSVRIRTELADGAAVETNRRWENPPSLPKQLAKYWKRFDIGREMTKRSVPRAGRSIEIVATHDSAAHWRQHQEHVERYASRRGTTVAPVTDLERTSHLAQRLFRHDAAVERRTVGFWRPLLLAYGIVGIVIVALLATAGERSEAIMGALVFAVLTPVVVYTVISKVRILPEAWRPPFA